MLLRNNYRKRRVPAPVAIAEAICSFGCTPSRQAWPRAEGSTHGLPGVCGAAELPRAACVTLCSCRAGEKAALRRERITAKRVARAAGRGFDLAWVNKELQDLVGQRGDMKVGGLPFLSVFTF